jgi:hypothetical protein
VANPTFAVSHHGGGGGRRRHVKTDAAASGAPATSCQKQPKTLLYLSLTPHPQAIELCDEDAQLNVAAFELAQRLHM